MKKYLKFVPFLAVAILVGVTVAYAGSLIPPAGDKTNTMHSLQDIVDLANGTPRTIDETLETPGTIVGAGVTLNDVYTAVESALDAVPKGGLPATGQTLCYDTAGDPVTCTGTGQDGDVPHGIELSYTDHSNGTVTDDATGLMWVKDPSAIGTPFDASMTWQDALTNCNTLNYGGHEDWRLPNIKELQSLVDFANISPAIDTDVFLNTQSGRYWSSTSFQKDGEHNDAWIVTFDNGGMDSKNFDKSVTYYVRCVR